MVVSAAQRRAKQARISAQFRDPRYINRMLRLAPMLYDATPDVPDFAQYFVGMETCLTPWLGLYYYKIIEEWEFNLAFGDHFKEANPSWHFMSQCANVRSKWAKIGAPGVKDSVWWRALDRRNAIHEYLGQPVEDQRAALARNRYAFRDYLRSRSAAEPDNTSIALTLARIERDFLRASRPCRPDRSWGTCDPLPIRCPIAGRNHRDRPCILCAEPWALSLEPSRSHPRRPVDHAGVPRPRLVGRGLESGQ